MTDNGVRVDCVPPFMVGAMWPVIGPLLTAGLLAGGDDLETVERVLREAMDGVFEGSCHIWVATEGQPPQILGAFGSRICIDHQGRKVLEVSALGGKNLLRWGKALTRRLAEFGQLEGCEVLQGYGRRALVRVYENAQIVGKTPNGLSILERALQ